MTTLSSSSLAKKLFKDKGLDLDHDVDLCELPLSDLQYHGLCPPLLSPQANLGDVKRELEEEKSRGGARMREMEAKIRDLQHNWRRLLKMIA